MGYDYFMSRLSAALITGGVLLLVAVFVLQHNARIDASTTRTMCRTWPGSHCDASIDWLLIIAVGVLGVVPFVAAWLVARLSVENESAEDLVG